VQSDGKTTGRSIFVLKQCLIRSLQLIESLSPGMNQSDSVGDPDNVNAETLNEALSFILQQNDK
jgi:hypothetical protein